MIIDGSDKAMMIDCKGSDRQELPYTVVVWIKGLDSKNNYFFKVIIISL
jgi:hypothetical protein